MAGACAVFGYHRGRGIGYFQDRAHVLVYMESYCLSVVCKLLTLRPEATLFSPTGSNRSLGKAGKNTNGRAANVVYPRSSGHNQKGVPSIPILVISLSRN